MSRDQAKKIVETYAQRLKSQGFLFNQIYLYGSFAKGTSSNWSDIDVCVVSNKFVGKDWNKNEQELWRLRRKIDLRIEPVGMSSEEFNGLSPLASEIKKTGIAIMV